MRVLVLLKFCWTQKKIEMKNTNKMCNNDENEDEIVTRIKLKKKAK